MKRTGLKYRFDPLDVEIWLFWHRCMWCGQNRWDCLHHIISPSSHGHKHTESNSSILNSSPMHNSGCHLDNGSLHHRDMEIKLLQKTYDALTKVQNYKLKEIDYEFINTYYESHYYEITNRYNKQNHQAGRGRNVQQTSSDDEETISPRRVERIHTTDERRDKRMEQSNHNRKDN